MTKNGANNHKHHTKQLIINNLNFEFPNNAHLVSILPPCRNCRIAISSKIKKFRAMYLTYKIRNRLESKMYQKLINDKGAIVVKINLNKRRSNKIEFIIDLWLLTFFILALTIRTLVIIDWKRELTTMQGKLKKKYIT